MSNSKIRKAIRWAFAMILVAMAGRLGLAGEADVALMLLILPAFAVLSLGGSRRRKSCGDTATANAAGGDAA